MSSTHRKWLWLPLSAMVLLTRCDCNFLGTAGAIFVSEQDEMNLGAEFDKQLRDSVNLYPVYEPVTSQDTAFEKYVVGLGQQILAAIPADQKPGYAVNPGFKFTLINADVDNAFAVPGGYVYIYTGIIKHMQDESELAGVLGHEITHVTHHHYRDAMVENGALSLLVQALVGNNASQLTQMVAQSFLTLATLKVSRSNESDADAQGVHNEANIDENPLGIAKFFQRMTDAGLLASVFSTHPASPTRVADVTAEVNGDANLKALADTTHDYKARFLQMTAPMRP